MILVTIRSKEEKIEEISVTGHSGYAKAGADIVCSAVSTAMYVSLGVISKVCPKYDFQGDEKKASMILKIFETNEMTNLVLENLLTTLQGIEEDYKQYLQIQIIK
jgi:uncharacterized protein YsxB (DUF464 family)